MFHQGPNSVCREHSGRVKREETRGNPMDNSINERKSADRRAGIEAHESNSSLSGTTCPPEGVGSSESKIHGL